jgi:RimJ/RimL family protein N-acetyltransferase
VITHQLADGVEFGLLDPWRAEEFAAHVERAREHLRPWIPFASTVFDGAAARELLQRFADMRARDTGGVYGIWVDGVLNGGTLFRNLDPVLGVVEIGVWLDPSAQGRGLIKTAVSYMIDYFFRVRRLHRVEWYCAPENVRSRAVAARLGMTLEGTTRSSFVVNGRRMDSEIWAVLADEWPPAV